MDKVEKRQCMNCGEELHGSYCSRCGQIDKPIRDFRLILGDFFSNFSLFDNRMMISLKYLLFAPGFLTNEYIEGRRVRYSSPLRMYLLISAIYFAVLAFTHTNTFFGTMTVETETSEKLRVWLPRFMFFLMPVLALFLKLILIKTKRYYYEHLIYSLHFYSFYFITIIGMALIRHYGGVDGIDVPDIHNFPWYIVIPDGTLQMLPFIYLTISMKKVYRIKIIIAVLLSILILILQLLFMISTARIVDWLW